MILEHPPETGRWQAFAFSASMHVLLVAFLTLGVQWKSKPPENIEVELWPGRSAPASETPPAKAETPPQIKPVEPEQPPPKEVVEPEKAEQPDIKVQPEKVKPKQDKPKQEKPKVVESPPRPPQPRQTVAPRTDPMQDINRALNAEASTAAINREQGQRAAAAAASAGQRAWIERIAAKVRGNTVLPPNLQGNPVAVFSIELLVTGDVNKISLKRSSGVRAWDEAAERAIRASSPFPKPEDGSLFRRDLDLILCPSEQGCR